MENEFKQISKNSLTITDSVKIKVESEVKRLYTKKIIGLCFLLFVICITVVSSIWIKFISKNIKSFVLTYINNSFLILLIPICYVKSKVARQCKKKTKEKESTAELLEEIVSQDSLSETFDRVQVDNRMEYKRKFHSICIILMLCWTLGNSFYNLGLTIASVTSSNTLSNSAILFILIGKFIIFKSKITLEKVLGLVLCLAGVVLLAFFEASTETSEIKEHSVMGDIYLIIGALIYSIYALCLKHFSKKHKHFFDMMEIFGYIGLYNLVIMPFFILILHVLHIETFSLPSMQDVLYIFLNAVIAGLISDLLQSYAITLLNPHSVSFGLALTIPLSYTYDIIAGNIVFNLYYLFGTILIFSAFCVILFESYKKYKLKRRKIEKVIE